MLIGKKQKFKNKTKQNKTTKNPHLGTGVNRLHKQQAWPGPAGDFGKCETKVSKVPARLVKAQAVKVLQWMDEFFAQHGAEQTS